MRAAAPLQGLLDARLVFTDPPGPDRAAAFGEAAARLAPAGPVKDASDLTRRLLDRERLGCTGLGGGVAIPHCKSSDVREIVLAVGLVPNGVDFNAPDGAPVTVVFLILSPADHPAGH